MQLYQQRVVFEKEALDEKIKSLTSFLQGPLFNGLPKEEQERLGRQSDLMCLYSAVLGERIAAFV